MQKLLLQIEPLSCPACGKKVEDIILKQPGVMAVKVFFRLGRVRTEFDETVTSAECLETIVSNLGYAVKINKCLKREQ